MQMSDFILKKWIYDFHLFELRDEDKNNIGQSAAPVSQRSGLETQQAWMFFQAFFSQLQKLRI